MARSSPSARPVGVCDDCGCRRPLARTGERGGPKRCGPCAERARRPVDECGRCGQVKRIAVREGADGTPNLCFACYAKTPRRVCGGCGQPAAIHRRARDGMPDLCRRCCRPPVARCSVCDRDRPCLYADSDAPVCWSCKPRRVAECAVCARQRPVKARSPVGPLCEACNWRRLRAKAACQRCGQHRRPALHAGGEVLCGDCAGEPPTRACTSCGLQDITWDRGRCPRCTLTRRLDRLRAAGPSAVIAQLEPMLSSLQHSTNPLTALQWLTRPGGQTLTAIARGERELSHAALDTVAEHTRIEHLRARLVDAGALPRRDELLAGLEAWTTKRLAAVEPGPDATTLRAFASWKVARELAARRARDPGPDALATTMPKRWITAAIGLTGWLHAQDRTLADLDQPLLDAWLADGPATRRRTIRPLIAWLQHHQDRGLRVPTAPDSTAVLALDDHRRLAALRTTLHDDTIDPRLRLAGCLVCLYAQPAARIVRLTTTDLTLAGTGAKIRLGDDPLTLPAQLRDAAATVLQRADTTNNRWLFAGQKAGSPMHPAHLARRLRDLGVPVARTRPGALAALAHRIPAPVLADLLGLGTQTTCRAAGDLKVDYASYVARRT